jgi:hypothetical protein
MKSSRRLALAFLLITTAALAVRVHKLSAECLSLDEASSWRVSTYSFVPLLWHCAANVHPPGYFLALKLWTDVLGDSVGAMRGLSVLLGVAAVGAAFIVAAGWGLPGSKGSPLWSAGLIAALLLALAPLQIEISRTARMYPLGVLCAALTTWLLLRALQCPRDGLLRWLAYGAAAAAFCYVHNYAFFTLAGQGAFALGVAARRGLHQSRREGWALAAGFFTSVSFAAALYSPWLPVLYAQTREVSAGYWIEEPTGREALRIFSVWFWGEDFGLAATIFGLALATAAGGIVIRRRNLLGVCFLVQAAAPWCFALALSWGGPASILQDRYFSFAQFALLCLAGRALALALRGAEHGAVAALLASLLIFGGQSRAATQRPSPNASFPESARVVAERYQSGDLIAVVRPGDVNLARYYLTRFGVPDPDVRFSQATSRGPAHVVHLGSVTSEEVLRTRNDISEATRRLWQLQRQESSTAAPTTMKIRVRHVSSGENPWVAVLYERE